MREEPQLRGWFELSWVFHQAGGSPAATHFLLLRQKKVSKEKATPLPAALRFATGNLRCSVQPGPGSNSLRSDNRPSLSVWTSAPRRMQKGWGNKYRYGYRSRAPARTRFARPRLPTPVFAPQPVGLGRGAQSKADQGERLSERSEFELDPTFGEHRRLPRSAAQGTQTIGSPFLW